MKEENKRIMSGENNDHENEIMKKKKMKYNEIMKAK